MYAAIQAAADKAKALYSEGHQVAYLLWNYEREWGLSGEDL